VSPALMWTFFLWKAAFGSERFECGMLLIGSLGAETRPPSVGTKLPKAAVP
jgi:hypothetical protein